MQDLKISLIQSPLHWENPGANMAMFEEKIWKLNSPTDLIVLPEMFSTGFTMNASSLAEPVNFNVYKWMKQMTAQTGAVITGSAIIKENGKFFNRLIWMNPDGSFLTYDKRHLFRMAGEHEVYTAGTQKIICMLKGWKICPLICYDLRFPVWSRNRNNEYDLLLYIANWPQLRQLAWNVLLQARAIENLSYVAGVNRIGEDGNGIAYSGDSAVIDPRGDYHCNLFSREESVTCSLSYQELVSYREKFPADRDGDEFEIRERE